MIKPKPTFKNTLQCKTLCVVSVTNVQEMAYKLGYIYYLWNDRVYETCINSNDRVETKYILKDLK